MLSQGIGIVFFLEENRRVQAPTVLLLMDSKSLQQASQNKKKLQKKSEQLHIIF